jgi:hypothetical protein
MSASSGGEYVQPFAPEPARTSKDQTGEPVGYNLSDVPIFEQPPVAPLHPYQLPSPTPMEPAQVATGFVVSLAGVVAAPFVSGYTLVLCAIGTLICAMGLAQSRRAQTRYPRLAIAGLVLGIIGVTVGFFLVAMVAGSDTPS